MINFYNYSNYNYNRNHYNCWSYYTIVIFIIIIISSSAANSSPPPSSQILLSSSSSTPTPAPSLLTLSPTNQHPQTNDDHHHDHHHQNEIDNSTKSPQNHDTSTSSTSLINVNSENLYMKNNQKICSSIQIRNTLQSFEQLRNCNIIDGALTIALVQNYTNPYKPQDFENLTFPKLYEITEYLLFFRVEGLTSLSKLFPNLAVIRGKELVSNYAFIIYQMFHLQEINLPNLTDILRGSVRIDSNPNLCYVTTINWDNICKNSFTKHYIEGNHKHCNNKCPNNCRAWTLSVDENGPFASRYRGDIERIGSKEDNGTVTFCWNNKVCHETCQDFQNGKRVDGLFPLNKRNGRCCAPNCAGGCLNADTSEDCLSCRSFVQQGKCVEQCAANLFEYRGKCISESECIQTMAYTQQQDSCSRPSDQNLIVNLKPFRLPGHKHGKCLAECPPGYEEDLIIKSKCKPCDNKKCRKVCTPKISSGLKTLFVIKDIRSLKEINGCNSINGSLEINIKGGRNVLKELEDAFQDLEEISGYLKISRSYPLVTLGFFKNLRQIGGHELDRNMYSLIIVDNPNLQELFVLDKDESKRLLIPNGKIFAHINPKLCLHRIKNLKDQSTIADYDNTDVSPHTNGDKETCSTEKLEVSVLSVGPTLVYIRIQNYARNMTDSRSLLYYLINYREVQSGNITMFDGKDGCNSQNDVWTTMEETPVYSKTEAYQETIIRVKPARRYALFVKTFTLYRTESIGATSEMIYFETSPDQPSIPQSLAGEAEDSNKILISWLPPLRPNGVLKHYRVVVSRSDQMRLDIDVCGLTQSSRPANYNYITDKPTDSVTTKDPKINTVNQTNSNNDNNPSARPGSCTATSSEQDVEIREESLTFQDAIIDLVYLKPCSGSSGRVLKKRWIEDESTAMTRITNSFINEATNTEFSHKNLYTSNYNNNQINYNINANDISSNPTSRAKASSPANDNQMNIKPMKVEEDTKSNKQIIDFEPELNETVKFIPIDNIKGGKMTVQIRNLQHFASYTITVYACHKDYNFDRKFTKSQHYNNCSIPAMTLVRTHANSINDKCTDVRFYPANETSSLNIVRWEKPKNPNGLIYGYEYQYYLKGKDTGTKTTQCVSPEDYETGRTNITNIDPGTYNLRIRALTDHYIEKFEYVWSDEIEFTITEPFLGSIMSYIVFCSTIVVVGFIVAGIIIYQQRRAKQELKKSLIYASVNPDYIDYKPDEWEVPKESLQVGKQVGTGSFGLVYEGYLAIKGETKHVAIKTTPPLATPKQRVDFLREASLMKKFDTFHVIKLLGVVSSTTPVYVIMEFMDNGDLKTYIRKQRVETSDKNAPKKIVEGIYMIAAQIADGMAYIHSKKVVHRDLAARNCMVSKDGLVKIGDFGLTRDLCYSDYYRRDTQGRLPVKWMAPEALRDNIYNTASDVWSYGIVMWEVATFGDHPYPGISNSDLVNKVKAGYHMDRPETCPEKLFYIIEKCWTFKDKDRPSFIEIMEYLWPFTDGKLYPNCFFRPKSLQQTGDSIEEPKPSQQSVVEDNSANGAESFPLLSWPSQNCANGMTNGVNHVVQCLSK